MGTMRFLHIDVIVPHSDGAATDAVAMSSLAGAGCIIQLSPQSNGLDQRQLQSQPFNPQGAAANADTVSNVMTDATAGCSWLDMVD